MKKFFIRTVLLIIGLTGASMALSHPSFLDKAVLVTMIWYLMDPLFADIDKDREDKRQKDIRDREDVIRNENRHDPTSRL